MLTVVTWLWSRPGRPRVYGPEHVNALRRMVARRYERPHRFVVVTDEPASRFAPGIDVLPDRGDFVDVRSPEGLGMPSCYRRLRIFSLEAREWLGPRIASLDLDVVLVGDVGPIFDRQGPVVLYRDPLRPRQANGSIVILDAGAAPEVWDRFDPLESPRRARLAGFRGSDQAWISSALPDAARVDNRDGVYSYRAHIVATGALPADARVVVFHGAPKPWGKGPQRLDWVRDNWGTL